MVRALPPKSPKLRPAGFSLVEVTLALGIVAVSLLSLIGLLPAGLGSLRSAMDQTVHAQVVQRVSAEVASADFASLTNTWLYFNEEGQLLAGTDLSTAYYSAQIKSDNPSMPGLTNSADLTKIQPYLKRIKIGISRANIPTAPVTWYAIQPSL